MSAFDPYFTFRLALTFLMSGYIIYEVIGLVMWYRGLPRLAQRMMLLKLLQFRSSTLKLEFSLMIFLTIIAGWLMTEFTIGI